jgi:hypothetical protein
MTVRKNLPSGVTSYDILKSAAVLLMIVDHVGYYFHDGQDWYRVFGRMCVPIWFFLIGYARTRALDKGLWIGTAILEAGRFAAGMPVLPVTILATFLAIRAGLDRLMRFATRDARTHIIVNFILFLLAVPSIYLFEYGTPGLMLAMFGWAVRQSQDKNPAVPAERLHQQMGWSAVSFLFWETLTFNFCQAQSGVMSVGVLLTLCALTFFRPREFPLFGRRALAPVRLGLQFCGRWTLEIYVAHIILFQTIASIVSPDRFPPFTFVLFPQG